MKNRLTLYFADLARESGQPLPLVTRVNWFNNGGGIVTAIARTWAEGDPGRCRLCPECGVRGGVCLVMVRGFVDKADAPLFDVNGLIPWDGPLPQPPAL